MSRVPSISHTTAAELKPRSSKDSRTDDLRSPPKLTTPSTQIKNSEKSPRQAPSGAVYGYISLKTPTEKPNLVKSSTDKDIFSPEPTKGTIKKDVKKNTGLTNNEKQGGTVSATVKPSSSKTRTSKAKSPVVARENMPNKPTKKSGSKDVNAPLMTDISEKAATPANLRLTLENIGTKVGSQTHRITLNSPTSSSSNRFGAISPIQKKSKGNVGFETDVKVKQSNDSGTAKGQLNTMLVGLTKPTSSNKSKGSSKVSAKDSNSVSLTPRIEEVSGIEDETTTMKKYKELLGMLKEKDREIKKLSQDKTELQSTLSCMGEELQSLRKVTLLFKERGKSVADIQDGLSNLNLTHSMHGHQRSMDNSSINAEIRPSGMPNGLVGMFQNSMHAISDRTGKTWTKCVDSKLLINEKRPSNTNNSSDNLQIGGRSSLTTSPNEESIRQRYDTCGEENVSIREAEGEFGKQQKKKKQQGGKVPTSGQNSPRKGKKGQSKKKKREATSVDDGNFLKKEAEEIDEETMDTQNQVKKRHPEFKSMTHFTFGVSKEGQQQNIDIGEALGELKNRVERLLKSKERMSVSKTQLLYQSLHDRLQKAL